MQSDAGVYRSSPRDRGYDAKWDRLSLAFRRKNPFCRFCAQEGRTGLAAVVDHILPVREYPDLKYDWSNLEPLCQHHHDAKAAWEAYARARGLVEQLPAWCAAIANRPAQFRPAGPSQS